MRQRSQVMAHYQFCLSSPAIPGVRQLFLEVRPGFQHGGRASYLPASMLYICPLFPIVLVGYTSHVRWSCQYL